MDKLLMKLMSLFKVFLLACHELLAINEPNIDSIIEKKMRENHSLNFLSIYPPFIGKTFGEIAKIIESDITIGHKFKLEIIEQAISMMVDLNKE